MSRCWKSPGCSMWTPLSNSYMVTRKTLRRVTTRTSRGGHRMPTTATSPPAFGWCCADSDDVNGLFRRDVNKSERSDAGICNDAGNYSHESTVCLFLAGRGVWGEGTAFEFP